MDTIERYARHIDPSFMTLRGVLGDGRVFDRAENIQVWDDRGRRYLDRACGHIKSEPLRVIHRRLVDADAGRGGQQCWTACRGFAPALGDGGTVDTRRDLALRMRSR